MFSPQSDYPVQEVVKKLTTRIKAPIPQYSHTTLFVALPRKYWVVRPSKTYIDEDKDKDQIVVGIGQKEKLKANSDRHKLKTKLWTNIAGETVSPISIVQRDCKIKGKEISSTATPFHKNNKLKAKITLNIKKADKSVNKKLAVEAALYKGIVLMAATLKTFCAKSKR